MSAYQADGRVQWCPYVPTGDCARADGIGCPDDSCDLLDRVDGTYRPDDKGRRMLATEGNIDGIAILDGPIGDIGHR